ncbi:MAG: hypothetical protein C4575_00590 [Desulforudis sp.]|nr:MAG: hypothetical protein C4575_00590 [Desulforudis sp.]
MLLSVLLVFLAMPGRACADFASKLAKVYPQTEEPQEGEGLDEDPIDGLAEYSGDNDYVSDPTPTLDRLKQEVEDSSKGTPWYYVWDWPKKIAGWVGSGFKNFLGNLVNGISFFLLQTVLVGLHWIMELVVPEINSRVELMGRQEVMDKTDTAIRPGSTGADGKNNYDVKDARYIGDKYRMARAISLWLILILIVIAAFKAIAGSVGGHGLYTARSIVPRTIFAVVGGYFSLFVCQKILDLSFVMSWDMIKTTNLASTSAFGTFYQTLTDNAALGSAFVVLIGAIVLILMLCILYIIYQLRLATILIMVVLSPVAFACYILDDTQYITYEWLKGFIAVVFMQFIHVIILAVFEATMLSGTEVLSACLMCICMIYLMIKVPSMMLRSGTASGVSSGGRAAAYFIGRRLGSAAGA